MAVTGISVRSMAGDTSDSNLLADVHRGDERAFEELFLRHHAWLHSVVMRVVGEASEADEIVQDTFLKLYEQPVPLSSDVNVRGWLYRVAANLAFNAVRSRTRRDGWLRRLAGRRENSPASDDPLAIVTADADAARVRECLADLPERQRHVLLLRASGYSYAEIAMTVGIKPGSVGTTLARAEQALRVRFERSRGENGGDR